jgi:hypothetical protein
MDGETGGDFGQWVMRQVKHIIVCTVQTDTRQNAKAHYRPKPDQELSVSCS